MQDLWFNTYVGTYTSGAARGIYLARFDAASGALLSLELAAELPNPTYLAIHPNKSFLYAVSEIRGLDGRRDAAVNAFSIAPETGRLTFLCRRSSCGIGPCHVTVDRDGRFALVANYASGSAAVLPIGSDGRLGAASDAVQHHGSGCDPRRQEGPHAHSITPSPDGRFALVADLGLDRIMVYCLDAESGHLTLNDPPWAYVAPGAGPRHLAFHPTLPKVYVVNELGNTVTVFEWDGSQGALREVQTISTLPPDFRGENYAAHVLLDTSGRFLYASNRGHDSIAVFPIDSTSGLLAAPCYCPTHGKWPRHFAIDPTGRWLLAANQESDSVVVFRVDERTGALLPMGREARVPAPVCIAFRP